MVVIVAVVIIMAMVVRIRVLVVAFLAVEHQEVQAERIERGNKNPGQHRKVCKTCCR